VPPAAGGEEDGVPLMPPIRRAIQVAAAGVQKFGAAGSLTGISESRSWLQLLPDLVDYHSPS
jgi:hypothetical protein